jgi:hypothetical protein
MNLKWLTLDELKEMYPDPKDDPTPWCSYCNARREADCDCGPIAENE